MYTEMRSNKLNSVFAISQVIISVCLAGLCIGVTLPLVSLGLAEQGFGATYIGLIGAVPAFGFVLAAVFAKAICRALGYKHTVTVGVVISAVSTFGLYDFSNDYLLVATRLLSGFGTGLMIVLGESWVNQLVTANVRGRIIGLYATAYTLAQVSGPSVLAIFGGDGQEQLAAINTLWWAHLVAFMTLVLSVSSVGAVTTSVAETENTVVTPSPDSVAGFNSVTRFFRQGYLGMMFPIFIFAYFDAAVLTLFPLVAESSGFKTAAALFMVSVIFIGDSLFQIPIGYLSDRYGRMRVQTACGGLSMLSCLAVVWLMAQQVSFAGEPFFSWLIWPVLIVMGAATGGLYTLSLTRIGDAFNGLELVSANASAGIVWSLGALLGPFLAGFLVEVLGEPALMLSLITLVLVWLAGNKLGHRWIIQNSLWRKVKFKIKAWL